MLGSFPGRDLIRAWLKAGVFEKGKGFAPTEEGTPQGGVISPLLLNVALHGLEQAAGVRYRKTGPRAGITMPGAPVLVRYADDFAVCCQSRQQAEQIKAQLAEWLQPRGLAINEDKTRIVHLPEGFDFLGFNIRRYGAKLLIKPSTAAIRRLRKRLATEMRALRGSNAGAVLARLNPIIRGWAAYYRAAVSSRIFSRLDTYVWRLTYKWAKHSHPHKSKTWAVARYFGKFNKFSNDRWVFGDRAIVNARGDVAHLIKFRWTTIVRHQTVNGTASPDDPALTEYWAARRRRIKPRSTGTRCACSPSRTAGARSAGTPCSPPSSLPGLPVNGRTGGCTSPERPSSTTISCTTDGPGDPAIRTVIKPAWYTPPANGRYAPDSAGAQHCNPARPSGLLEPCAGKPARTVLRGPRRSNAPGLPD